MRAFSVGERVTVRDVEDVLCLGSVVRVTKNRVMVVWDEGGRTSELAAHLVLVRSVPMRRVGWMLNYGQAFTTDAQTAEKWKSQGLGVRPIYERKDK